jgi:hypothetical protein
MIDSIHNTTPVHEIRLPKVEQLFLELQTSAKVPKRKQVHSLRKRRRAEKIAPSCPL